MKKVSTAIIILSAAFILRVSYITFVFMHSKYPAMERIYRILKPGYAKRQYPFEVAPPEVAPPEVAPPEVAPPDYTKVLHDDEKLYDALARGIAFEGRFVKEEARSVGVGPMYPLFLAGIYRICGTNYLAIGILQAIIDTLTCFFVFLIAQQVFRKKAISLIATGGAAIYLPFIFYTSMVLTETLFTFLMIAFFFTFLSSILHLSLPKSFASGIILGVACLVRPVPIILPIFLLIFLLIWPLGRSRVRISKEMGAVIIGMVLAISPWTIRNYIVYGKFIPISTGGASSFLYGTDILTGKFTEDKEGQTMEYSWNPDLQRAQYVKGFRNLRQMKPNILGRNFLRLWFNVGFYRPPSLYSVVIMILHLLFIGFTICGLLLRRGRWKVYTFPMFLLFFYYTVINIVGPAQVRYIIPVIPYLIILSANGIYSIKEST